MIDLSSQQPGYVLDEAPFAPEELSERWSCATQTITAICRRGELRGFKVGKLWRIGRRVVAAKELGKPE